MEAFNIDTKLHNKITRSFIHLNQPYGFSIFHTSAPTRKGEIRESCIDHVLTNCDLTNENTYVLLCDTTDHYMLRSGVGILGKLRMMTQSANFSIN